MSDFTLTLVQPNLVWESPKDNFSKIEELLASSDSSDLIVLPEMFPTGFTMDPANNYDEPEGRSYQFMKKLAQEKNSAVCGSIITKHADSYYNRLYFVFPDGSYKIYDKRHLFTYGGEHKIYSGGSDHLVVEHRGLKIMPLVCYDLRFPVWCRNTQNVDLQLYVANWPERRNEAWKTLLKARAIENMCCVAGLNRVGEDDNGVDHSGDSIVLDELGGTLLQLTPSQEEVASVKIDKEQIKKSRERFHFLDDRDQFKLSD